MPFMSQGLPRPGACGHALVRPPQRGGQGRAAGRGEATREARSRWDTGVPPPLPRPGAGPQSRRAARLPPSGPRAGTRHPRHRPQASGPPAGTGVTPLSLPAPRHPPPAPLLRGATHTPGGASPPDRLCSGRWCLPGRHGPQGHSPVPQGWDANSPFPFAARGIKASLHASQGLLGAKRKRRGCGTQRGAARTPEERNRPANNLGPRLS